MSGSDTDSTFLPSVRRLEVVAANHLRLAAPAKINLNLLVAPRRDDGYHRIDSYVAKVSLYDTVDLKLRDDGAVTITCAGADCGPDERNLALQAAMALPGRDDAGADIKLTKRIAPGKGLGGGSSDAAAVLWGLRRLWGLGLTDAELGLIGASLGSDVPLFLGPPAARVTGRGDRIEQIEIADFRAVICIPHVHCSTPQVYATHDTRERATAAQLDPAVLAGSAAQWRGLLRNDLTAAAEEVCPALAELRVRLARCVSQPVCLTGSGSAMFILCEDSAEAGQVIGALDADLRRLCVVVRSNPW